MSVKLDLALKDNHTAVLNLPKTPAQSVAKQIELASERLNDALFKPYCTIKSLSLYWSSDDTGGKEDSELFQKTVSKLGSSQQVTLAMSNETLAGDVTAKIMDVIKNSPSDDRKLFILHYAGHGWGGPDSLHLCAVIHDPTSDEAPEGAQFSFAAVKDVLKEAATRFGIDVLFVMDCCCAAAGSRHVAGRLPRIRIEFVAATTERGLSNSREDGETFTQNWCKAFETKMASMESFTSMDVLSEMGEHRDLAQYPRIIILDEGLDLPITFCKSGAMIHRNSVAHLKTIIAVFHLEENPNSTAIKKLVEYLEASPVPISVLATLPALSTFLLVRMPFVLQEFITMVPKMLLKEDA